MFDGTLWCLDYDGVFENGDPPGPFSADRVKDNLSADCMALGNQKLVNEMLIPGRNFYIGLAQGRQYNGALDRLTDGVTHWYDMDTEGYFDSNQDYLKPYKIHLSAIRDDIPKITTILILDLLSDPLVSQPFYDDFVVVDDANLQPLNEWTHWTYLTPEEAYESIHDDA